ncbi:hypothetical protein K439DRAFT_1614268 [Ramaria rubella]|nr:hypothetical protein K439DRAFT_1614268 [Ramaria rubella]
MPKYAARLTNLRAMLVPPEECPKCRTCVLTNIVACCRNGVVSIPHTHRKPQLPQPCHPRTTHAALNATVDPALETFPPTHNIANGLVVAAQLEPDVLDDCVGSKLKGAECIMGGGGHEGGEGARGVEGAMEGGLWAGQEQGKQVGQGGGGQCQRQGG